VRRGAVLLLGAAALAGVGCREPARARSSSRVLPKGDAIWLTDPRAASEPDLESKLRRLSAGALFLPAGQVALEDGRRVYRPDPAPPARFERVPVVLVIRIAGGDPGAGDSAGIAREIASVVGRAAAAGGPYGRVAGVLIDAPATPSTALRLAPLATAVRAALPQEIFLALPLREAPSSEPERKAIQRLLPACDALVAPVFGLEARTDPVATDALGIPWWPAYRATARGIVRGADGTIRGEAAEKHLDPLSGDPRADFVNDLSSADQSFSAFHLTARAPIREDGLTLNAGDRVDFAVPALPEMLFQLGAALAGKRRALGRVLVFDGSSDAERLFQIAAFEDVLLGRSLLPVLEPQIAPSGRTAIWVDAANRTPHASVVSRTANWVEIDLAPAHPADVAPGGFDRYEVYDSGGSAVTPGRATRVRLFETLVAPGERILPARITARGALARDCCRYRTHTIAAAGPESATDWAAPPAPAPPRPSRLRKK